MNLLLPFLRRSIELTKQAFAKRSWLAMLAGVFIASAAESPQLDEDAGVRAHSGSTQNASGATPRAIDKLLAKKELHTPTDGWASGSSIVATLVADSSQVRSFSYDDAHFSPRRHSSAQPRAPPTHLI